MFLNYLNNFRGFAMLFIVAYHILPAVRWNENSTSHEIVNVIFGNCSILFMFISGFLFQYLLRKYKYADYLKKKFQNVIMPYLFMSIPAILLILYGSYFNIGWTNKNTDGPVILRILKFYITGEHLSQFWFIPMITFYYLSAPLFKLMDSHPKFYMLVPVFIVISMIVGRPAGNNNPAHSFLFYLPVYLTGMLSSHWLNEINDLLKKYNWLILSLFVGLSVILFYYDARAISFIQKLVLCLMILYYFRKYDGSKVLNKLDVIATFSFGIYFIHMYVLIVFLALMKRLDLDILRSMGVVSFILMTALTTLTSIYLLKIIKLVLRKNSRMIIGC